MLFVLIRVPWRVVYVLWQMSVDSLRWAEETR